LIILTKRFDLIIDSLFYDLMLVSQGVIF